MKKIRLLISLSIALFIFPVMVFASGSISPSTNSITVTKGQTTSFTITASNAVGRVDISSSNSGIAIVDKSTEWLENNTIQVTVTGVSSGSTVINVALTDAATFDEEELNGSYSINVIVNDPPVNNKDNNQNSNPSNNNTPKVLSKNNNLKELSVEGYEIEKIDDHNYVVSVSKDAKTINIKAKAEDSKASIKGLGDHILGAGESQFEIVVTSESGSKNKIILVVMRQAESFLDDIDELLKDNKSTIDVTIKNDSKIKKDILDKIKNSKKAVNMNYLDENDNLLYSWTFDGSKITESSELVTGIDFNSSKKEEILKSINYSDCLILNFAHSGKLPNGTKVKINVSNKYSSGENVNLYYYDDDTKKLELVKENIKVDNGFAEFELDHCSTYLLSKATFNNNNVETKSNSNKGLYIGMIIEGIIIFALGGTLIYFINKKKNVVPFNQ